MKVEARAVWIVQDGGYAAASLAGVLRQWNTLHSCDFTQPPQLPTSFLAARFVPPGTVLPAPSQRCIAAPPNAEDARVPAAPAPAPVPLPAIAGGLTHSNYTQAPGQLNYAMSSSFDSCLNLC